MALRSFVNKQGNPTPLIGEVQALIIQLKNAVGLRSQMAFILAWPEHWL